MPNLTAVGIVNGVPTSGTGTVSTIDNLANIPIRTADGSGNLITSTSNALDVNVKSGNTSGTVDQGSVTAGQQGNLIQGAVTSTSPTYASLNTSPLSLDTSGNLRVNVVAGGGSGGTSSSFGFAMPGTGTAIGASDGAAMQPLRIKPASTSAVAADPALVMQLSPNSPGVVPLGQTTKSASIPVTLASDTGTLSTSVSGTVSVSNTQVTQG